MKKVIIILAALVIAGAVAVTLTRNRNNDTNSSAPSQNQSATVRTEAVNACSVLTDAVAKQILGDNAEKGNVSGGASTDDVAVSNCTYTAMIDPNAIGINNIKGIGLLARSGKTNVGAESNKSQFGSGAPSGSVHVEGIGDDANFNPETHQLNVLKGGNWYIVSSYTGSPTTGTQEDAVKLARLLQFK